MSEKISQPKIDRFTYTPITRGHKPTPSQESNTLSTASCMTNLSDYDDDENGENEDKVDGNLNNECERLNASLSICLEEANKIQSATQTSPLLENNPTSFFKQNIPLPSKLEKAVKIDIPSLSPQNQNSYEWIEPQQKIRQEPLKTLLSGLFMVTGFLATTFSLTVTHDRYPEIDPLPDVVFENIKYQPWGLTASEYLLLFLLYTAICVVLFHRHRLIIVRRIWFLLGILYYYRAVTMFITVLPKSDETYTCHPKSNNTTPMVYLKRMMTIISGGGLSINGNHVYCGDYIFSGHTVTLTMAALTITQYSPKRFLLLHWASYIISILGVIFLLLGRGHYSIDVLIAYFITTRLWWTYHTLAHTAALKTQGEHNSLDNLCWWHVFRWFEDKVPGPLPNRYSIPLPRRVKKVILRLGSRVREAACWSRTDDQISEAKESDEHTS